MTRDFGRLCLHDPDRAMAMLRRHAGVLFIAGAATGMIVGLVAGMCLS